MDNDKIRGIVLKEYPMGESSKRIVVLTKDRGKITLSVRGGKNALSKFLTSTQLFCYSDFVVCKSKGFLFVNQSEVIESFYALREDIERLACSAFVLEVVEKTVFEQMESKDILRLLLRTMKAMAKEKSSPWLVVDIFLLRYLKLIGLLGEGGNCNHCQKDVLENGGFSNKVGGVLCEECKNILSEGFSISAGTLRAISHVLTSTEQLIFSFTVSDLVLKELTEVCENYLKEHISYNFYTLNFAKSLEIV